MPGFFENISKKAGEAVKKSGDLVEITKLNMNITNEEGKIQTIYKDIGKKVYDNYCNNEKVDELFVDDCTKIKEHENTILDLKNKIMEIKSIKICTNCGAEIDKSVVFCPKCGAKQDVSEPNQP
jgi:rubrerythrin